MRHDTWMTIVSKTQRRAILRLAILEPRVRVMKCDDAVQLCTCCICGCTVHKKTVLGTLGRSRSVEVLKHEWPDHELLVYHGDRKRHRDRKMRAYVQEEADEWEREMHPNETATDGAWNASESRDAWGLSSWDEGGTWEAEDDQFEGSFADEDEEEAFNLARTPLNETLASERNARRTVAEARATMRDITSSRGRSYPQGANKKGSEAGKGKSK